MSTRQGAEGTQGSRRSARLNKAVTPEVVSDSAMISGSPTPTWSRERSPVHPCSSTAGPENMPFEEDEFMPKTQEVAETLTRMKSIVDNRDRGNEVGQVPENRV
jgi:hypothetical protein